MENSRRTPQPHHHVVHAQHQNDAALKEIVFSKRKQNKRVDKLKETNPRPSVHNRSSHEHCFQNLLDTLFARRHPKITHRGGHTQKELMTNLPHRPNNEEVIRVDAYRYKPKERREHQVIGIVYHYEADLMQKHRPHVALYLLGIKVLYVGILKIGKQLNGLTRKCDVSYHGAYDGNRKIGHECMRCHEHKYLNHILQYQKNVVIERSDEEHLVRINERAFVNEQIRGDGIREIEQIYKCDVVQSLVVSNEHGQEWDNRKAQHRHHHGDYTIEFRIVAHD